MLSPAAESRRKHAERLTCDSRSFRSARTSAAGQRRLGTPKAAGGEAGAGARVDGAQAKKKNSLQIAESRAWEMYFRRSRAERNVKN